LPHCWTQIDIWERLRCSQGTPPLGRQDHAVDCWRTGSKVLLLDVKFVNWQNFKNPTNSQPNKQHVNTHTHTHTHTE
jgi:hypothetical protein